MLPCVVKRPEMTTANPGAHSWSLTLTDLVIPIDPGVLEDSPANANDNMVDLLVHNKRHVAKETHSHLPLLPRAAVCWR